MTVNNKIGQKNTNGSQSIGKKEQKGQSWLGQLSDWTDVGAKVTAVAGAGVAATGAGAPVAAAMETGAGVMEGVSIASGLLDKMFY